MEQRVKSGLTRFLTTLELLFAVSAGALITKYNLLGPTPGTYFALGVLATICIGGVAMGVREGLRIARRLRFPEAS